VQSILNVSSNARTLVVAALTLSASLTALVLWAGAAPAAPAEEAPCTIVGTEANDIIHGTTGDDAICGLGGSDHLYGEGGNDVLRGGDSVDILRGGPGRDVLEGGNGRDRMHGGSGADVFRGGGGLGDDLVAYWGSKKPVTITIGDGANDGPANERDDVQGDVEAIGGTRYDDTLIGNGEDNEIWGHRGNDRLVGGAGRDYLVGGEGDDTLDISGDLDHDSAKCGDGLDSVLYDAFDDLIFALHCENFRR
jgi:Ca2+-binding RTX toxin-like protein